MYLPILGLISEYNPFHNGHLYHFNTSSDLTQAEYSICVLSGNFMQRGEPAVIDKWSRTLMALKAGIDLVIELPVIYCAQSAEIFAYGSISILNSLGIVDSICFGSESGDIDSLKHIASILNAEPPKYREYLKEEISKGISFASARARAVRRYAEYEGMALGKCTNDISGCNCLETVLKSPNNILGLEYIKWIMRLKSTIVPYTIKRVQSGYNDESLNKGFASAWALRKAIKDKDYKSIDKHMPHFAADILKSCLSGGRGPVFLEDFTNAMLCNLRRMSTYEISSLPDVSEGLENRIKKAAIDCFDIEQLITNIKSKRYAESRIRRILINSLLGIRKSDIELYKTIGPQYIRVLGFSDKGRNLLSEIKKKCSLPIITNVADYKKYNNKYLSKMIEMDILSTDIYVTAYSKPELKKGGYDFYTKPVMI